MKPPRTPDSPSAAGVARTPFGMQLQKRLPAFKALFLLLVPLIVYLPALKAGFIWDDDSFLFANPLILSDDGWIRFWATTEPPDYFPLVSSLMWVEWRLWGGQAFGFHLVNVLLHAGSALLMWRVLRRLGAPGAFWAALLYAVHPVCVESVAWITERKNCQPMLFFLLSLYGYLRFDDGRRRKWYLLSLAAHLAALLSKTSVVMMPFLLLLYGGWRHGRLRRRDVAAAAPFFALSLALGLVTLWYQTYSAIGSEVVRSDGFLSRLAIAGKAVWFYLYKALLPLNLSFVYPRWETGGNGVTDFLPLVALAAIFALLFLRRRRGGLPVLLGLGFYVIMLFPVLGFFDIFFMRYSLVADHWQYTPLAGVTALAAGLLHRLLSRRLSRFRTAAVFGVLCLLFGALSTSHARIFTSEETLWRAVLAGDPDSWMAHNNLGLYLMVHGRHGEARPHFEKAVALKPPFAKGYNNLGLLFLAQGQPGKALEAFRKAEAADPGSEIVQNNMGLALKRMGRVKEAADRFRRALALDGEYASAHENLALIHLERGTPEKALGHLDRALRRDPGRVEALHIQAQALAATGRYPEAVDSLLRVLERRPGHLKARMNLSMVYLLNGDRPAALREYGIVRKADPALAGQLAARLKTLGLRPAPLSEF